MMLSSSPFIITSGNNSLLSHRTGLLGRRGHLCSNSTFRRHKHENATMPEKHVNTCAKATLTDLVIRLTPRVVDKGTSVTGTVIVKLTTKDVLLDTPPTALGETLNLELVSSELDPGMSSEKETVKAKAHIVPKHIGDEAKYEAKFIVPKGFGEIGAVLVQNPNKHEMFISSIVLKGLPDGPVRFVCDSWVHSIDDSPHQRVFFSEKSYLPSETPDGLKRIREQELENLRGNGHGERKKFERIYDYDTYNDLGDPDNDDKNLSRPVLGTKDHPYPRRCRTGRPPCKTDPSTESRTGYFYVPRDEEFSEVKQLDYQLNKLKSVLHSLIPTLEAELVDPSEGFANFPDIDNLFQYGLSLPNLKGGFSQQYVIPRLIKTILEVAEASLKFEVPELTERDELSLFRDEEFARQFLAGLNPYSIQRVAEWPLKSKLSSEIYGPPESLITKELVEEEIQGCMTLEEALKEKRLFIVDYHDLFLPYVSKINEIEGNAMYASRTLLFKRNDDTLQLLAIELTRPPVGKKPQWKQVFRPSYDSTECWLWRLAKVYVAAVDAGYHQLISHWLRTHCCTEPYIIAANRQLSAMHPVYRLLKPHFRYTMEINALARKSLINAGGTIESTFTPDKYCMELSSAVYDKVWRFDKEAFPADLIRRGMAVEDPTAYHGLKLTIEDYPFASDGIILWDAITDWVTEYVNHYYPEAATVQSDVELQAWWTEVRIKGHADKKDEPWWPVLNTQDDLIQVLCTIIWVSSGHHAAVNFGQYPYGGYFPNRPSRTRATMPTEDPEGEDYKNFLDNPVSTLMKTLPSKLQATTVMAVYDILSSHSPEEEYIGQKAEASWQKNPVINGAFGLFTARLKELEGTIDERNRNMNLKNRTGAGIVPYELLKPRSGPGVTGKGVPNSISI